MRQVDASNHVAYRICPPASTVGYGASVPLDRPTSNAEPIPDGIFTAYEIVVSNGAVGFERLVVHFSNGVEEVLPDCSCGSFRRTHSTFTCAVIHEKSAMSKSGKRRRSLRADPEWICSESADNSTISRLGTP